MKAVSAPETISLHRDRLTLHWARGEHAMVSAVALRAACRCAECRAPSAAGVQDTLGLTGITPVGQYAIQLTFSDGHSRGIYPWTLLYELGHPE